MSNFFSAERAPPTGNLLEVLMSDIATEFATLTLSEIILLVVYTDLASFLDGGCDFFDCLKVLGNFTPLSMSC